MLNNMRGTADRKRMTRKRRNNPAPLQNAKASPKNAAWKARCEYERDRQDMNKRRMEAEDGWRTKT